MPVSDQGVLTDRYMLVPRTLIFLTRGERVLLIKGAAKKRLWANRYNGVGGHVEAGEDILSAARRELLEETGLVSADLRLCGTVVVDTGRIPGPGKGPPEAVNPGICIFVLRGECSQGEPAASAEGTLEWVRVADLGGLPQVEDLPVLLGRVLAMKPDDPPFSALSSYDEDGRLRVMMSS